MLWALWFVFLGTLAARDCAVAVGGHSTSISDPAMERFLFLQSSSSLRSLATGIVAAITWPRVCCECSCPEGKAGFIPAHPASLLLSEPWKRAQHLSRAILIRKSQQVATSFELPLSTCLFGGHKSHQNRKSLSGITVFAGVGSGFLLFQQKAEKRSQTHKHTHRLLSVSLWKVAFLG